MTLRILCVGEILWDVFKDAEHIGGAAFNFAAHASRLGHSTAFVSAVGNDPRGQKALARTRELGLDPAFIRTLDKFPTGTVSVFVDSAGQPAFTIHRPAAYDFPELSPEQLQSLSNPTPDWIYYGTLAQLSPDTRSLTRALIESNPRARRFYDINLRLDSFNPGLVQELLAQASFLKINDEEVAAVREMVGESDSSLERFCREYRARYEWEGVCVTRGALGCALLLGDQYLEAPGYRVKVADTVGSGDAFAAALIHGLGHAWHPLNIADFANRVGALVASRPGAVPDWSLDEISRLHL